MSSLPAIVLEGPRAVGKTETARRRAKEVFELDDPAQLEVVAADPGSLVGAVSGTVLIDEWQRHPPIWDFVRRQAEQGAPAGRFLLTGSAIPTTQPVHPGSGRLVELRVRPMSLAERQIDSPVIGLAEMLSGDGRALTGTSAVTLPGYVDEILASGFPGIRPLTGRGRRAQLDSYLSRVVDRDFPELGLTIRRPATLRAWHAAYAAATSTTTTYNKLLGAATPGEAEKPAKTTTIAYRDVLERLYLVDPVPGWLPTRNRLSRLSQAPKTISLIRRWRLTWPALTPARFFAVSAPNSSRCATAPSWAPSSSPWSRSVCGCMPRPARLRSIIYGPGTETTRLTSSSLGEMSVLWRSKSSSTERSTRPTSAICCGFASS